MREGPQSFFKLYQLELIPVAQFPPDRIQNLGSMPDQWISFWIIPNPPSVTPGRKQSSRLQRTQINAGLILRDTRIIGDFSDEQTR